MTYNKKQYALIFVFIFLLLTACTEIEEVTNEAVLELTEQIKNIDNIESAEASSLGGNVAIDVYVLKQFSDEDFKAIQDLQDEYINDDVLKELADEFNEGLRTPYFEINIRNDGKLINSTSYVSSDDKTVK